MEPKKGSKLVADITITKAPKKEPVANPEPKKQEQTKESKKDHA